MKVIWKKLDLRCSRYWILSSFSHWKFNYIIKKGFGSVTSSHQSLLLTNQKQGAIVRSYLLHFLNNFCKNAGPKPFRWAKAASFNFSSSYFNVHHPTLSTVGDPLQRYQLSNKNVRNTMDISFTSKYMHVGILWPNTHPYPFETSTTLNLPSSIIAPYLDLSGQISYLSR